MPVTVPTVRDVYAAVPHGAYPSVPFLICEGSTWEPAVFTSDVVVTRHRVVYRRVTGVLVATPRGVDELSLAGRELLSERLAVPIPKAGPGIETVTAYRRLLDDALVRAVDPADVRRLFVELVPDPRLHDVYRRLSPEFAGWLELR